MPAWSLKLSPCCANERSLNGQRTAWSLWAHLKDPKGALKAWQAQRRAMRDREKFEFHQNHAVPGQDSTAVRAQAQVEDQILALKYELEQRKASVWEVCGRKFARQTARRCEERTT